MAELPHEDDLPIVRDRDDVDPVGREEALEDMRRRSVPRPRLDLLYLEDAGGEAGPSGFDLPGT